MDSSVVTIKHAVRRYFLFAHIDGLISSDPAVYARLPKVHRGESRTRGLDRLELAGLGCGSRSVLGLAATQWVGTT